MATTKRFQMEVVIRTEQTIVESETKFTPHYE